MRTPKTVLRQTHDSDIAFLFGRSSRFSVCSYCEFEDLLLALDALPLESQGTRVTLSRQEIVDMVIPNAVQL